MARRWTAALLAVAAAVALALGACAPDLPGVWDCTSDDECFQGERCQENVCVAGAAQPADEDDGADAGADAEPSN